MTKNKVTQIGVKAGGHVSGGDLTVNEITIEAPNQTSLVLNALYKKYENEKDTKVTTDGLIQQLKQYYIVDDATELRDLERKLKDGGRTDLIKRARFFKQSFRQKIEIYRFLPAAQEIYAYLLGFVLTRFDAHATPAINKGLSADEVTALIQKDVIEFIMASIPGCDPIVDHPVLHGMIHFLTGNCLIDWDKK